MLKLLAKRQYSKARTRAPIKTGHKASLICRVNALANPFPTAVQLKPVKPCVVYSDACGEGRLGAVLCTHRGAVAHFHVPLWMCDVAGGNLRRGPIDAMVALLIVAIYSKHTPVVLFVDKRRLPRLWSLVEAMLTLQLKYEGLFGTYRLRMVLIFGLNMCRLD